jgi:hypothetical protein
LAYSVEKLTLLAATISDKRSLTGWIFDGIFQLGFERLVSRVRHHFGRTSLGRLEATGGKSRVRHVRCTGFFARYYS